MMLGEAHPHALHGPEWVWSEDYKTAKAVFVCEECGKSLTFGASVTKNRLEYTATVSAYETEYSDTVSFTPGDCNGDRITDGRDLVRLRRYLSCYEDDTGESDVPVLPGADINGDGRTDGRDLIRLRKLLSEGENAAGSGPREQTLYILFDKRYAVSQNRIDLTAKPWYNHTHQL